jgi:cytochrome c oxidase subunit 1
VAALVVGVAQILFLFNLAWSVRNGKPAGGNPWRAASLEWFTPHTPPQHGNWGPELPVAYRGAYDYGRDAPNGEDYFPQNVGPEQHEHGAPPRTPPPRPPSVPTHEDVEVPK